MSDQATFLLKTVVPAAILSFCKVSAIGILLDSLPRIRFPQVPHDPGKALAREAAIVLIVLGLPIGWIVTNVTGDYTALVSVVFAIVIMITQL